MPSFKCGWASLPSERSTILNNIFALTIHIWYCIYSHRSLKQNSVCHETQDPPRSNPTDSGSDSSDDDDDKDEKSISHSLASKVFCMFVSLSVEISYI